ncbi:alpha/beta fold hydrolase [Streptomyces sp. NPDC002764]|uniref:alpha/beta fold hydrolase n=1 Tax=unclassified Streptomyces TaxID=2593676 RepID=UPI00332FE835
MIDSDVPFPTMLLVHGAWHGSWCWDELRAALHAANWSTRTVDLPSAGQDCGMYEDAQAILDELGRIDGPVVIVAHSYGGIPVTQAAAKAPDVARIIYLAAYQLDVEESLLGFHGAPLPDEPHGLQPVPDDPLTMFYGDVPDADAREAVQRLVPQSVRSFGEPPTQAGWHTVASAYIVCEHDQALPPQHQEALATRSGEVHRLASGHSPFLSMPHELAALLAKVALGSAG